jgi:hypothetical protein
MTYVSTAIETQGFKFEIAAVGGSPLSYTEVKEITAFNGFDGAASEIDVTHLQSAAKEFLMGLQDFGTFQLDVNHLPDDTGQVAMRTAKADRDKREFRVTFSDANTATFQGYVLSNSISGGVDAKVDGSFTVRITGNVTFA